MAASTPAISLFLLTGTSCCRILEPLLNGSSARMVAYGLEFKISLYPGKSNAFSIMLFSVMAYPSAMYNRIAIFEVLIFVSWKMSMNLGLLISASEETKMEILLRALSIWSLIAINFASARTAVCRNSRKVSFSALSQTIVYEIMFRARTRRTKKMAAIILRWPIMRFIPISPVQNNISKKKRLWI